MKKTLTFILAVCMVCLALAGCTAKEPAAEPSSAPDSSAAPGEAAPGGDATTAPASGKTEINLAINRAFNSPDPSLNNGTIVANQVLWQAYEGLVFVNASGAYEPRVAERYELSSDGLVYTFHINPNAKFHNGDAVKASDVVYSIERALRLNGGYWSSQIPTYESITAVDDATVEVKLTKFSVSFLESFSYFPIISEAVTTAAGDDVAATTALQNGTGPYMLMECKGDTGARLEAFDDYYRGAPAIKVINYKVITNNSTRLAAFENGELDMIDIPTANWSEISSSGNYTTYLAPTSHDSYIFFNDSKGPLADIRVRQALAYATNRDDIIIMAYDGLAEKAYSMLNPNFVAGSQIDTVEKYEYNPEKAKALLAEAGYAGGVDAGTLVSSAGSYYEKIINILQAQWAEVGVTVQVQTNEAAVITESLYAGKYDICCTGRNAGATVDSMYGVMGNSGASFVQNHEDALNNEIDALFIQGAGDPNEETRNATYSALCEKINTYCAFFCIFHKSVPYAWNTALNAGVGLNYYFVYDFSWE